MRNTKSCLFRFYCGSRSTSLNHPSTATAAAAQVHHQTILPLLLLLQGVPDAPRCGFSSKVVDALRSHNVSACTAEALGTILCVRCTLDASRLYDISMCTLWFLCLLCVVCVRLFMCMCNMSAHMHEENTPASGSACTTGALRALGKFTCLSCQPVTTTPIPRDKPSIVAG